MIEIMRSDRDAWDLRRWRPHKRRWNAAGAHHTSLTSKHLGPAAPWSPLVRPGRWISQWNRLSRLVPRPLRPAVSRAT